MIEQKSGSSISPLTWGAGVLVVSGFLLTGLNWGFLVLVGVGAFGPGLLRELGWVHDKDELQLQASRRAGYHAFLAGGLVAVLMIARARAATQPLPHAEEMGPAILAIMWFVSLFSSLYGYWGPRKTALRVLIIFGLVWLLFNIISNSGPEYQGMVGVLMQSMLAFPFFFLAWLARVRPRLAGALLTACSLFFFYFFHIYEIFGPDPLAMGRILVLTLFIGPLLVCGLTLVGISGEKREQLEEAEPS